MGDRLVYESKKSKVFRRQDDGSGTVTAVKVLNHEFPTPADIAQFHNEFDIISDLKLSGIRGALRKTRENNRHVLEMEWVDGENLKTTFRQKSGDIADALHIAIATARALAEIHHHHIIHKDISPFNILVDLQERRVRIIDFGISTNLDLKQPYVSNPELIEGTLAYCSPEQTGRMNCAVDFRADLYSLGLTFYEILAGAHPFEAADAMGMVHAHLAQVPAPLQQRNPKVPAALSAIVDKLLAKDPDDRYQSADGLRHDLERCLQDFQKGRVDAPAFALGEKDHSLLFRLPQRLYGREPEVAALLGAFDRCAHGARLLVLVGGYSGTGKTSLVHEVHKPITARRGYFSSGKFDQFQRATPYFAFVEAFKDLVDALLTEREERLDALRGELRAALGAEGRVVTNVLPNLEHIIGPQPPIPEVGGTETLNRFNYLFRKFVRALCTAAHPVVIFIDDMQWADSASLNLLHVLMTDPECGHFMLVCAYRENEVSAAHPFTRAIDDIRETGVTPETIRIGNLTEDDLAAMLADALDSTRGAVAPLARLVHDKTQGNAFFAAEFLKSLAAERLLAFDPATARWQWDADLIAQKNIAENVVDLMAHKVRRLDPAVQETLRLASCIGSRFDLETLCVVHRRAPADLAGPLKACLGAGLLCQLDGANYKFSHDRVQQAVYSLIPARDRAGVHLEIGRLLLASVPEAEREARIFDITNQLNGGRTLITARDAQIELATLNLQAGNRAKLNSAFPTALQYFETGISLVELGREPWKEAAKLTRELFTEAAEAAYLNGEFERMDGRFRTLLREVDDILDKVKPYEVRILAYKAENRLHDAIETGLEVLAQLGERFPARPNLLHVVADLVATNIALSRYSSADLMSLPQMAQPQKIAAMRIIADITSSVYWGRPNLLPLIVFRMVRLSLRYGNNAVSCFAYGSYGVILCGVLGFMRKGAMYARLSLDLLEKLNAKEWKAQIYTPPYALTFHWTEHVRGSLRPLQESFQIGLETGLIEFGCVNTNIYCIHSFLCGRPLERVEEETRAYSDLYRQFKQETNYNYNEVFRQSMLNFMGRSADPVRLVGEAYDEERMIAQNHERGDKTGTFFIQFQKLLLCYYFRHFAEAREHARSARKLLDAVLAKFEIPNLRFYDALTVLALAEHAPRPARWRLLLRARLDMLRLKYWAHFSPANHRHKYDLCAAEYARVTGNEQAARLAYDRAITGASQNEFVHEEALAFELAGRFYANTQRPVLAEFHLKAAYNAYREWGAAAKLRDLVDNFPKYLSRTSQSLSTLAGGEGGLDPSTSMLHGAVLDITTVLKASTTISREVVPSKLLSVLMKIVLENAGAQRGFILLDGADGLAIQAHGEDAGETIEVLQDLPTPMSDDLSVPLAQFVHRTREPIVIADASSDERCRSHPYVVKRRPVSILCVPILNGGRSVGVLYLENNLAPGAFTRERVDLLTLLSGQIAVSIDNAMLYEKLEQKVTERTAELDQEKRRTDDLLHNILPAETAAELKRHGRAEARHYDRVTVLFTDFEGFTELAATLAPADLVRELDDCFNAFDVIVARCGVEKIKTIGDAYMAVGGLPVPNSTHPEDVVQAALEMRDFIAKRWRGGGAGLGIRIGVHTGPVVAGIVGRKKFQYDVWGDTVNTAARMESSGAAGQVNISQTTHDFLGSRFKFAPRGELEAKGKGRLAMFFVDHLGPPDDSRVGASTTPHHGLPTSHSR
jgi:predicted ATPase/class 3 adenylate cyclase